MAGRQLLGLFGSEPASDADMFNASSFIPETPPSQPKRSISIIRITVAAGIGSILVVGGAWVAISNVSLMAAVRDTITIATAQLSPAPAKPASEVQLPSQAATPDPRPRQARAARSSLKATPLNPGLQTTPEIPAGAPSIIEVAAAPETEASAPIQRARQTEYAVTNAVPRPTKLDAAALPRHIYSVVDEDVTPPELRRPQKLTSLRLASRPDDVLMIEVVINERGTLDSARAMMSPRSVGESLLLAAGLHAVKSWEFRPALKDGLPVTYKKLMPLGAY